MPRKPKPTPEEAGVLEITPEKLREVIDSQPIRVIPQPPSWLTIIDKMIDKGTPTEILTRVFKIQREGDKEMQRRAFVAAFAAFKAEAPPAIGRTGSVSYQPKDGRRVEYNHVELDQAVHQLTKIMSKHGLTISWDTQQTDSGAVTVSCRLEHVAGHARSVTLRGLPDTSGSKNAIQAIGSTITYLERYTFMAVLGIAQAGADSDGRTNGNGNEPLTTEQISEIEELLERSKADRVRFLKVAGVDAVDKIPRKDFAKWGDMLDRKVKQTEAAQ